MLFLQNTAICLKKNNTGICVTFLVHKACYNTGVRSDDYESHAEDERTGQEAE